MTSTADRQANDSHISGQPLITVIGDGQLARMMQPAAVELGQSLRVLASDTGNSAAQVIPDVVVGDFKQLDDLKRAVHGATAVTFDHEHVPTEHLEALQADGVEVQPRAHALVHAQDKLVMRKKLREIGAPVPPFAALETEEDAREIFSLFGGDVCLKATRGGYDGHGVWFPETEEDCVQLWKDVTGSGTALMAERKVKLTRELSAMVARTPHDEVQVWPVVESVQTDGICALAIAPAPGLSEKLSQQCQKLAIRIARELDVTGVMAVELFESLGADGEPEISVNELAMRPHNTGHWTQDGCVTSQFEQHLRAVAGMPLGSTELTAPCTVMANVLGGETDPQMPWSERMKHVWRRFPEAKIHFYGKDYREGRKIGHVNISAPCLCNGHEHSCTNEQPESGQQSASSQLSPDEVRARAELAAGFLVNATWADGYA